MSVAGFSLYCGISRNLFRLRNLKDLGVFILAIIGCALVVALVGGPYIGLFVGNLATSVSGTPCTTAEWARLVNVTDPALIYINQRYGKPECCVDDLATCHQRLVTGYLVTNLICIPAILIQLCVVCWLHGCIDCGAYYGTRRDGLDLP